MIKTNISFYNSIQFKFSNPKSVPFKIINYKKMQPLQFNDLILIAVNLNGKLKLMCNNIIFNAYQSNSYSNKVIKYNTYKTLLLKINDQDYELHIDDKDVIHIVRINI